MSSEDIWPPRERWVGAWLLVVCAFVVAMILVGGATRLTDSGLSITEWDLGKGLTPPLTDARWAEEFALYQRTMEYQTQNNGMSLEEFRSIYWWEWAHRFLGKMLGLVFAVPALIFLFLGRLRGRFRVTLLLFALGAAQGAIGWWMVTSGLFDRLDVSPLRLAVHLGMALTILAIALYTALGALGCAQRAGSPWAAQLDAAAADGAHLRASHVWRAACRQRRRQPPMPIGHALAANGFPRPRSASNRSGATSPTITPRSI
ncbi:MAG: COX15/CtaA family protein [Hyphomonadaceae bacterium]